MAAHEDISSSSHMSYTAHQVQTYKQHAESNTLTAHKRNCLLPNPTSMHAPRAPRWAEPESRAANIQTLRTTMVHSDTRRLRCCGSLRTVQEMISPFVQAYTILEGKACRRPTIPQNEHQAVPRIRSCNNLRRNPQGLATGWIVASATWTWETWYRTLPNIN